MRLRRMDTTVFLLLMVMGCSHGSAGHFNVTKDDESQNTSTSIVKIMPESADFKKITLLTDPLPEGAIAYPKIGGSSRCTTCLERTSKYCCKTPQGRCCDYGYEPPKNDIIRIINNDCVGRTKSTVCPDLTNRKACLTSTESRRNSSVPGGEIHGQDCAWCPNGPCLSSNGDMDQRCQPESWVLDKQIRGIETCLAKKDLVLVYGDVRGGRVYYQISHEQGTLDCYFKAAGSSVWRTFAVAGPATYHTGYAECPPWRKGYTEYTIKLTLSGETHLTDESSAVANGAYTSSEKCYDKYRGWCKRQKSNCYNDFKVRTLCKKTCNLCGKCVDEYPDYCEKMINSCKTDWEVHHTCKATCNVCD